MHSMWHPILMMETEKALEIFSFYSSGPKRLNEITAAFFRVPFLASFTTHGAERTLSSLNDVPIMEHAANILHEAITHYPLQWSFNISLLRTKLDLSHLKTQPVPRSKHSPLL
jgi:hypothetical protein